MVALLRRAFISMCHRIPVSALFDEMDIQSEESDCTKLSGDLLLSIFRRLPARDLVMASLVCKTWNFVSNDQVLWESLLAEEAGPKLWPSLLFAEGHLRTGGAIREPCLPLPFHVIYGERSRVPRSVIIDGGSGYCKYGWSDQERPEQRFATFLEFGNIESPIYPRLKELFITLFQRMQAKPNAQPIVLTAPISHSDNTDAALAARKQLREITHLVLFELGVPAICYVNQAVLALFAADRTSGIVVNMGFHVTSVVPILHGKVMRSVGVEIVGQGAMQLTVHLGELMQHNMRPAASMYTVRTLKENLCYVAEDFEEELNKADVQASFGVHQEGTFTLEDERFRAPEILFQPRLGRLRTMSLQQAVALCMEHSATLPVKHKSDENWFKTVVLSGGTACLPGLAGRLKKEVCKALSSSSLADGLEVLPPKQGPDSAWCGAKLISNVSTFPEAWCLTKKKYKRYGPASVHSMALEEDTPPGDTSFPFLAKKSW
ncbi:actin-related protein 8, plant [Marchantia polymorpha subsp. ruderalis]|uniref:F-box domain-containing protein n=2 Tax=Marchantia polymorpha TaxID=3197 RepID=A0AAF6B7M9_MARPO|nr:hypothetical protein MARPO_0120s0035 [Marchantia polymorpha]BBN08013.1 hypothetical protein Mp_4g08080 [Marchantia polymorpha subsp. ruderalis]|eukprot:PTQ30759.1 hypothetical protein MARPO_0120s0035 [Marchantia polymorpha]